jgi:uncharacterized protein YbjT (DUF2867 family)
MNDNQLQTLIIGGTGKTGRRVAQRLERRGVPAAIASRSGTPAFNWNEPASWAPLLSGARAVYLAYHPDVAAPGAAERLGALSRMAVHSGVQRIVLLSGRGEPASLPSERAVSECGAAFTILRCAFFCQNFSEGALLEPVLSGEVAFPAGEVAEPFIDAEDIADVAVEALTRAEHAGKIDDLTGPRLLTFAEAAQCIASATSKSVRYVPVTPEAYRAALAEHVARDEADFWSELFRKLLDGHNAQVSAGVEQVLGRKPRDFAAYVRDAAAAGAWNR